MDVGEEYDEFVPPLFLVKFTYTIEQTNSLLIRATDANQVIEEITQQITAQGGVVNNVEVNLVVENVRGQDEVH